MVWPRDSPRPITCIRRESLNVEAGEPQPRRDEFVRCGQVAGLSEELGECGGTCTFNDAIHKIGAALHLGVRELEAE